MEVLTIVGETALQRRFLSASFKVMFWVSECKPASADENAEEDTTLIVYLAHIELLLTMEAGFLAAAAQRANAQNEVKTFSECAVRLECSQKKTRSNWQMFSRRSGTKHN
jgi:hypothetical protein